MLGGGEAGGWGVGRGHETLGRGSTLDSTSLSKVMLNCNVKVTTILHSLVVLYRKLSVF